MPGVDMSIEQLKEYKGIGLEPEDFSTFWGKAKEKIDKSELLLTRKEEKFRQTRLHYQKISICALDGTMLSAKFICPVGNEKYPIVVQFHEYAEASRSWFYLSRYAAAGYAVLAPDCRGQGGESGPGECGAGATAYGPMFHGIEDKPENMYLYHLYEDAFLWIKAAKQLEEIDCENMVTYGDGQGGALALACAAMYPEVYKCAANFPMLCDYRRVWEMDFDVNAYEGLHYYFRWKDPLHEKEEEIFNKLSYMDLRHFAPYVKGKVIMGTGLQDSVSPPSAQFAVFHALQCQKKHYVYPKYGHERNNFFENTYFQFLLADDEIGLKQD